MTFISPDRDGRIGSVCRALQGITSLSYLYINTQQKKELGSCLMGYLWLQHALLTLTVTRRNMTTATFALSENYVLNCQLDSVHISQFKSRLLLCTVCDLCQFTANYDKCMEDKNKWYSNALTVWCIMCEKSMEIKDRCALCSPVKIACLVRPLAFQRSSM